MTNKACWCCLEKNGLLFLETSALESTNVEAAFNNVLAGNSFEFIKLFNSCYTNVFMFKSAEIQREALCSSQHRKVVTV